MTQYKIGTISQLLKSSEIKTEPVNPDLSALFAGATAPKVFKTVKVSGDRFVKKEPSGGEKINVSGPIRKRNGLDKLQNKDAASIRVAARQKVKVENPDSDEIPSTKLTKDRKLKKKLKRLQKDHDKTITEDSVKKQTGTTKRLDSSKLAKKSKKKNKQKVSQVQETRLVEETGDDSDTDEDGESADIKQEPGATKKADAEGKVAIKTLAEKNAPKPKNTELEARTIFLGNLKNETTKKELMKLFKKFGKIETLRFRCAAPDKPTAQKKVAIIKKEFHPDNNTIAAYIRYASKEAAEKAVEEAKGMILHDHHVTVDMADQGNKKKDTKKAIFVGNLSLKLTDEELWRFFEGCGKIDSVRVVRDNATGLGKGFGYVNFEDKESVSKAILTMNQRELKGRLVRISRSVKKPKTKKEKHERRQNRKQEALKKDGGNKNRRPVGNKPFKGKWKDKNFKQGKNSKRPAGETKAYSGDRLAEIGKLKRKSNKPNKGEIRKVKILRLLNQPSNKKKVFK